MLIALSLFFTYLMGLGLLLCSASPHTLKKVPQTYQETARFLSFNIIFGISLNHLLLLLIKDIKLSLSVGAVLSVIGFCSAIAITRKNFVSFFVLGRLSSAITVVTALFFSYLILNTPLEWDGRYIWFFHGKMIYYNGGLTHTAGWSNPAYRFSHTDYPMLLPILSAQFTYLAGHWNDFLPRLSLLALLLPVIFGVASFIDKVNISSIFLYLMFFFSLNVYTINGYMDGYLAMFASMALLFLCRSIACNCEEDLFVGFAFLSITPLLKNEGILFVFSAMSGLILFAMFYSNKRYFLSAALKNRIFISIAVLLLANVTVWSVIKLEWGLRSDLAPGLNSIKMINDRIHDGSIFTILKYILTYTNVGISFNVLLLAVILSAKINLFCLKKIMLCITTTSLYFFGLVLVYMSTPYDLQWHLSSSVYRTMMTVNLSIIVATYILLTILESSENETPFA